MDGYKYPTKRVSLLEQLKLKALCGEMVIERNTNNKFTTNFSGYSRVGFHGTSSLASGEIEKVGILPNKVFDPGDHQIVLTEARTLGIDVSLYEQWLQMRSITFTKKQGDALAHIKQGSSGGQGLGNMLNVLKLLDSKGNRRQQKMANNFIARIDNIRNASSIVYAVDLSSLGKRLVQDLNQNDLYQVYFDPQSPLPSVSIVTPTSIIARLDVI